MGLFPGRFSRMDYLGRIALSLRRQGRSVACVLRYGSRENVVLEFAQTESVDLVVMVMADNKNINSSSFSRSLDHIVKRIKIPILLVYARGVRNS